MLRQDKGCPIFMIAEWLVQKLMPRLIISSDLNALDQKSLD